MRRASLQSGSYSSGSGVPPLKPGTNQRRDASATLTTAPPVCHPELVEGSQKLPAGWVRKTIGEIAKTSSGGTPSRGRANYYGGAIPWVKSGELGDRVVYETAETITDLGLNSSSAKIFPKGTLCIALYGATVGKLGILGIDAATNQAVCGIFLPDSMDTRYVFRYLESKRRELVELGKGGAQPNISQEIVRQTQIPVSPLPEQRRIVAEIEKQFTRLEAGVAALRRVQANLHRYRAAVLKAACEGKLVPMEAASQKSAARGQKSAPNYETGEQLLQRILKQRREKWDGKRQYTEPAAPNTSGLPKLPAGWCVASLEQLTSAVRPICYGILMPKENLTDGVLFVKVKDMKGDKIDIASLHRTSPEIAAKYVRASLRTGDLLLAIRGTYGRVAEVPKELDGGNITQDTARLDVTSLVSRRYVATYLRNPDCQTYFKRVARGVAVKGVNIGDVRPTPVPLPPLAEQERIVAEVERRLSVVEELSALVENNLKRATRMRQAILQQAFEGKLC